MKTSKYGFTLTKLLTSTVFVSVVAAIGIVIIQGMTESVYNSCYAAAKYSGSAVNKNGTKYTYSFYY